MLVLTRKTNESIMIGDEVEVSVLGRVAGQDSPGHLRPAGDPGLPQGGLSVDPGGAGGAASGEVAKRGSASTVEERPRRASPRRWSLSETAQAGRGGPGSAHQPGQRLEHHHGHGHDRDDERDDEDAEGDRAALLGSLDAACAGAVRGPLTELLAAAPLERRLLLEGELEQLDALSAFSSAGTLSGSNLHAHPSGRVARRSPTRRGRKLADPMGKPAIILGWQSARGEATATPSGRCSRSAARPRGPGRPSPRAPRGGRRAGRGRCSGAIVSVRA